MAENLPANLMKDVYWAFSRGVFESEEEFNEAVRQYQIAIKERDDWKPQEIVFPSSSIRVGYEYWTKNGDELEAFIEFQAADGEAFSAGELLFKINNAVAENVMNGDHIFFEGLSLSDTMHEGESFYWMHLGS